MGLTLVAVLTAALLLPGIIAARSFYRAGQTNEIEPTTPALSSSNGIALVGVFSVATHLLYVVGLRFALSAPPLALLSGIPPANPYRLFVAQNAAATGLDEAFAFFSALFFLGILAWLLGSASGWLMTLRRDRSIFYGPMAEPLATTSGGKEDFVMAYVLSKLDLDDKVLGYQGTVVSLLRDEDRFPAKVILKNVSVFYMTFSRGRLVRRELGETIDWIALDHVEWRNIAFKVFAVVDDSRGSAPAIT